MPDTRSEQPKRPASVRRKPTAPVAIVGIGVCMASLASLEQLVANLEKDLDAAFVIAVRQQEGLTVGEVIQALSRRTKMPVKIAADGEKLASNHIFVGGPDDMITITDGTLATRPAEQPVGRRGTVDSMLVSLAEHAQDRAIAVILAGLGSEGTAGVSATKKYGGLSIAESVKGESEALDQGATPPAGIVDLLLPIEHIPAQIELYIHGLKTVGTTEPASEITAR